MLLSVVVYKHKITAGQWVGTEIVFAGILVEAWVERQGEDILLQPAARSPLSSRGELTISLLMLTLNASRKRRRRHISRDYSHLDLGLFVAPSCDYTYHYSYIHVPL